MRTRASVGDQRGQINRAFSLGRPDDDGSDASMSAEANLNALASDFDPSYLRGTKLGRYELLAAIGKGGMASVWVARDTSGKQTVPVAIKVIREELAREPKIGRASCRERVFRVV